MSIFDQYEGVLTPEVNKEASLDYHYTDPSDDTATHHLQVPQTRSIKVHAWFGIVIILILLVRLFVVQVFQGQANAALAKEHSIRQVIVSAQRGGIFDRRGEWLARNIPSFRVQIVPTDLPKKKGERQAVYDALANTLQWTEDEKKRQIAMIEGKVLFQFDPVVLKDNLPHDQALILTEHLANVPAVAVVPQEIRQYNQPDTGLSHILGYVGAVSPQDQQARQLRGTDTVGKTGLEASYDPALRGKDGVIQAVVDSKGKVLGTLSDRSNGGESGNNVVLHLDLRLQSIMAQELKKGLSSAQISSGVAIAINPKDGGILGMVSLPAYDNNQFASGIPADLYQKLTDDSTKPLFNRATLGTYPSGSTIKPFVAAVGIQDGVITEKTRIDTPPEIQVGPWTFPNWQHIFISQVDVKTAIAKSNDIFFYAVSGGYDKIKGLGVARLSEGLGLFGFGHPTGIDLPSEKKGLIPNEQWKITHKNEPWYIGDTYHMGIGQGDLLVTPLQLVVGVATIANGGTLFEPHLVDHIADQNGNTVSTIQAKVIRDKFMPDDAIRIAREGMRQAVTDGSARQLNTLPVEAAGKTGTAQAGVNNEFLHSWFTAFAPYNDPQIAIVVLGERGSQQNEGNTTAEPIAKAILDKYFSPDFQK